MSCRQWLSSALRQCQSSLAKHQQPRLFSTSASFSAIRDVDDGLSKTPERRLGRSSPDSNPNEALHGMLTAGMERGGPLSVEEQRRVMEQHGTQAHIKDMRQNLTTDNYVRQMPRRWRIGEVYSPRDMKPAEMSKWRQGRPPKKDMVDILGFSPLDNYRNFSLISEFMTPMGRIRHSTDTGLRPVNQRKIAKAVRRAIGMGLHPSVHRHPEILRLRRHGMPTAAIPTPADPSQNRL